MKLECMGKLTDKDIIKVDPRVFENVAVGSTLKVSVMIPDAEDDVKKLKELSPAAKRILDRIQRSQDTGVPDELNHGKPAEEGVDPATERFLQRVRNAPRLGHINEPLSREDLYEEMVNGKY